MSVGDVPILDFLPQSIHTERGWMVVNDIGQTSDVKVFAVGDATRPGLVTNAIGQGRVTAEIIHTQPMRAPRMPEIKQVIPYERIRTEYYDVCRGDFTTPEQEANKCMSCATCRDCHMCETTCYWGAISRVEKADGGYEYVVDEMRYSVYSKPLGRGSLAPITKIPGGGVRDYGDVSKTLGIGHTLSSHRTPRASF